MIPICTKCGSSNVNQAGSHKWFCNRCGFVYHSLDPVVLPESKRENHG